MSISFRQIRKNSTAQGRFKDLVSDYQRFQAEQVTVDNPDFRVKLRTMHSKLMYHDPFLIHKTKPVNSTFYMPFEPDGKHVVAMWDMDHNGRFCIDGSGFGHHAKWMNNPPIREGLDLGFGTSLYARFDGKFIFAYRDDAVDLRLSLHARFAITCRIYPEDISASDGPGGNKYRTILHKPDFGNLSGQPIEDGKIDDGGGLTVSNGYHLAVTPDGRVRFSMMRGGFPFSVETLPGAVIVSDPPLPHEIAVIVNQIDRVPIPAQVMDDPGDLPGADVEAEPLATPPTDAPNMQIVVNNKWYQVHTTDHLAFVGDSIRRLRIGATYNFGGTKFEWFKWKGGIQQIRFYDQMILTFSEVQNLYTNKLTIREMPYGSPALAGYILVFEDSAMAPILGPAYDAEAYDPGGFDLLPEFFITGFPGYDDTGFDETGFDTLPLTEQGTIQDGGFDPRGFSFQGFDTIPQSQS